MVILVIMTGASSVSLQCCVHHFVWGPQLVCPYMCLPETNFTCYTGCHSLIS